MQALVDFDKWLFLLLNGMHHPAMDWLMTGISSRWLWIPFYLYLLYELIARFKFKAIYLVLFTVLMVAVCDQLSVHLFKNVFMRLRPCHDPSLADLVHIVNDHCGGQFGFISSHASNAFGLAFFMGKILKKFSIFWMPSLLLWAAVVSYSRIYLGVHFPLDVACGALFGMLIAELIYIFMMVVNNRYGLKIFGQ
jgi:undecaprenyl-diphosphatase